MTNQFGPQQLESVGNALYGRSWQSDMARDLGMADARRIRYWAKGERDIPPGIWRDLSKIMRLRAMGLIALADGLDEALRGENL